MGGAFSADGAGTQFLEHVPLVGYVVSAVHAANGDTARAKRAASRATGELVKGVIIAGAVVATPFTGVGALGVWAAAGAAGDLAAEGIESGIESSYTEEDKAVVGTENLDEWQNHPIAETFFIHAAIGAAEGVVAGTIGTVVDGAMPAAEAEIAAAEAGDAVEAAIIDGLDEAAVAEAREVAEAVGAEAEEAAAAGVPEDRPLVRMGGRREVWNEDPPPARPPALGERISRAASSAKTQARQAISYVAKETKNSGESFLALWKKGRAVAKTTLTTRQGFTKYLVKKGGITLSELALIDSSISKLNKDASKHRRAAGLGAFIAPVMFHIQGCIGRNGLSAVKGHMHISTAQLQPRDKRDDHSTFAYVTHDMHEHSLLTLEEPTDGSEGVYIRTTSDDSSADQYLSVSPDDARDETSLYVHVQKDKKQAATWAIDIYEDKHPVIRLVSSGIPSHKDWTGGHLIAHHNLPKDRREKGGSYLAVSKRGDDEDDFAAIFGFRFMRPDKYWWMDAVGEYNERYSLYESLDHQGLYWCDHLTKKHTALYPKRHEMGTLIRHNGDVFCDGVEYDHFGRIDKLLRETASPFKKMWWKELEGMTFETHIDKAKDPYDELADIVTIHSSTGSLSTKSLSTGSPHEMGRTFTNSSKGERAGSGLLFAGSGLLFGFYDSKEHLWTDSKKSSEPYAVFRDASGFVTALTRYGRVWRRFSLEDLLGRFGYHYFHTVKKHMVYAYVSVVLSADGKNEVWWQSNTGHSWTLHYKNMNELEVGKTCPDCNGGFTICRVVRDDNGNVTGIKAPRVLKDRDRKSASDLVLYRRL